MTYNNDDISQPQGAWIGKHIFLAEFIVYGRTLEHLNDQVKNLIENKVLMKQYEKSEKGKRFENPTFIIEKVTDAYLRNANWAQTFKMAIREKTDASIHQTIYGDGE